MALYRGMWVFVVCALLAPFAHEVTPSLVPLWLVLLLLILSIPALLIMMSVDCARIVEAMNTPTSTLRENAQRTNGKGATSLSRSFRAPPKRNPPPPREVEQ